MNWKFLDAFRRDANAHEVNLVEAYAQRRIGRRDFIRRGTVIGLSVPTMSAVLAACGDDDDTSSDGATGGGGGTAGGTLVMAIQQPDAATGLDPVNMLDLGTYNLVSQSFEYLVGTNADGTDIDATGLATSWEPNEDGSVWTFQLREATFQSGAEFTSADVAASMDRLAVAGNSGLNGVLSEGGVDSSDPRVAVFNLDGPNGNFPYLVSTFNAQALITPADYSDGTTLSERPDGTGAWVLDEWNEADGIARYSRNADWWGGTTPLEAIELRAFADLGTAVTAMSSREVDLIQQFQVIGGDSLFDDDGIIVDRKPTATHREIWFNTNEGDFTDARVREAVAYALDREGMLALLFEGGNKIANDHPFTDSLPFFPEGAVEQRAIDLDRARSLLADAGMEDGFSTELHTGDIQEIPELAAIVKNNLAEIGIDVTVRAQSNSTFYETEWCPALYDGSETEDVPCGASSGFGIVDYGDRPVPDVFLSSAFAGGGVWNSSNWNNDDFDAALVEYQSSLEVAGQKAAAEKMVQAIHSETPMCIPYFYEFITGRDESVSGVTSTGLGHVIVSGASKA